jgi:signal transduction histidine kinase
MTVVPDEWLSVWLPELRSAPHPADLAAPITHEGRLVGFVSLERRPGAGADAGLEAELTRVVGELCHRLAPLIHNARLDSALRESLAELRRTSAELTASRARVVHAADDERRRIERNLHDGAQQHLVAVMLELRLARELARGDRARADEVLARVEGNLEETLEQLRVLAHGVYPPELRDRGLEPVLAAAGRRASLPAEVRVETTRHSAAVEATVYFCCLEAIANACKHAGPDATLTVHVWEQAEAVLFEVADDGCGFHSADRRGVGLLSLEDRVGALGGTLTIESASGAGTRIHGVVPVASAA